MPVLHVINTLDDPRIPLLLDDPVRPEIPIEHRIGPHNEVLISLNDEGNPTAAVCVKYCNDIPTTVDELLNDPGKNSIAVFYTIWSYKAGAGAKLIFIARDHVEKTRPEVSRFVTLSPQTDSARRFHLRNGAVVFRENDTTVNYEYE